MVRIKIRFVHRVMVLLETNRVRPITKPFICGVIGFNTGLKSRLNLNLNEKQKNDCSTKNWAKKEHFSLLILVNNPLSLNFCLSFFLVIYLIVLLLFRQYYWNIVFIVWMSWFCDGETLFDALVWNRYQSQFLALSFVYDPFINLITPFIVFTSSKWA